MVALTTDTGPVKPVSGEWQTAQACPFGVDRLVSKNRNLPSFSWGVRFVSLKTAVGPTHIRLTISEIRKKLTVELFCFIEMPSFLVRYIIRHATRTELTTRWNIRIYSFFLFDEPKAPALLTTLALWILNISMTTAGWTANHPIFPRVENGFVHFGPLLAISSRKNQEDIEYRTGF
jgi:hypothetical protein